MNRSNGGDHIIESWAQTEADSHFGPVSEIQRHRQTHQRISERVANSHESPIPPGVAGALVVAITIIAIACAVVTLVARKHTDEAGAAAAAPSTIQEQR